jgi:hypothetical protein
VISLREIAQKSVDPEELKEALVKGFQKTAIIESEPEEVLTDLVLPDPKMGDDGLIGGGSMKDVAMADDDDDDDLGDDLEGLSLVEEESFADADTPNENAVDEFSSGEDS